MKRGRPLKRRSELARSEFKRDVEKVREFMQRGRQGLERAEIPRKVHKRPPEGPLSPAAWRAAVFEASDWTCIVSGARARDADDSRFEAHHPLPKRALRARRLYGCVWDPRNGVVLSREVHDRHEHSATFWVSWRELPVSVWAFCAELDAREGSKWATDLVLRLHPDRAERGSSQQEDSDGAGRERDRAAGEGRPAGEVEGQEPGG